MGAAQPDNMDLVTINLDDLTEEELLALQAELQQHATGAEEWTDPYDGLLTQLLEACTEGDTNAVQQILGQRSTQQPQLDISCPGPDGDTALHLASLYGHEEVVALLLSAGADAGAVNQSDGSSVLHDAAATGVLSIVERVLQASPESVTQVDTDGDTPLHNAARGNHLEVVQLLLKAGADKSLVNADGNTPAQEAEEQEVIDLLKQ